MTNEYLMLNLIYDLLLSKEAERLGVISTENHKEYVINALDTRRKISETIKSSDTYEDFERMCSLQWLNSRKL